LKIETVNLADVERYLDALRMKRRRGPSPDHSRRMHRASERDKGLSGRGPNMGWTVIIERRTQLAPHRPPPARKG
jgi:hypothetical protein